jgi:carbamoyltransferase
MTWLRQRVATFRQAIPSQREQQRLRSDGGDITHIGYANTFHDPAIAVAVGDDVFAEGLERPYQLKRALWNPGFFYAVRQLKDNLKAIGFHNGHARVVVRTTWKTGLRFALAPPLLALIRRLTPRAPKTAREADVAFAENASLAPLLAVLQINFLRTLPAFEHAICYDLLNGRFASYASVPLRHHLCHAAAAVFTSPFKECCVMVVDGSGEIHSAAFFHYRDGRFKELATWPSLFSLGFLYAMVTRYCGFSPLKGEEWKMMGLAPYGKINPDLYAFFKEMIALDGLSLRFKRNIYRRKTFHDPLMSILGSVREPDDPDFMASADLAHTFQRVFSETMIDLVKNLHALGLSRNLAYGGGCALNSVTNGMLVSETGFQTLHIPCAPGDDGNALGAVLYQKIAIDGEARSPKFASPYLGSAISNDRLQRFLDTGVLAYRKIDNEADLIDMAVERLLAGAVVGWIQGRAEFGPRALGNRSILADPRRADIRDRINLIVKAREAFRPLGPSVLHERGPEFFENYQYSPYMERVLTFRPEVRHRFPAVVHADGSGRAHSVTRAQNPMFHRLIERFDASGGVPMLLNTSYNVMGKPIVSSELDAIGAYLWSGLDCLVIGSYILSPTAAAR